VLAGHIAVRADGRQEKVDGGHALALGGSGGQVALEAIPPSHLLVLSGARIDEPVVTEGPFIMNEQRQIDDAIQRYRIGANGAPRPALTATNANLAAHSGSAAKCPASSRTNAATLRSRPRYRHLHQFFFSSARMKQSASRGPG
jgi:Pirin C-terminal cupin domain